MDCELAPGEELMVTIDMPAKAFIRLCVFSGLLAGRNKL
jgi:hypothetical protein